MYYEEEKLQKLCVAQFLWRYPEYYRLLHHSANEGSGDAKRGARLKALGVQAGFPDLILCVARQGYHGLAIEMKTEKGRQSESQKEYQRLLEREGYKYVICRSLDEFIVIMRDYLGPERNLTAEDLRMIQKMK